MWKNIARMSDEGWGGVCGGRRTGRKSRWEGELREDLSCLGLLNSFEDPSSRYANRVRSFRAAGRKADGGDVSPLWHVLTHDSRGPGLDQSPCVPHGVMLGTGNEFPPKSGVGPKLISFCPNVPAQWET